MDRQQVEGVTASSESPGYNTLDEFIYVRQVGYGSVTAGVVGVQIWFFEQRQNSSLLQLCRKYARFQEQVACVRDDWCSVTTETFQQSSSDWVQFT